MAAGFETATRARTMTPGFETVTAAATRPGVSMSARSQSFVAPTAGTGAVTASSKALVASSTRARIAVTASDESYITISSGARPVTTSLKALARVTMLWVSLEDTDGATFTHDSSIECANA